MPVRRLAQEAADAAFRESSELPAKPLFSDERRTPFVITTVLRQQYDAQLRAKRAAEAEEEAKRKAEKRPRTKKQKRTQQNDGRRPRAIVLSVNPSEVTYQQAIRGSQQKTKSGTVYYTWRDRQRRTTFDNAVFTFNFQSGSIVSSAYRGHPDFAGLQQTPLPAGQRDYYEFKGILDESKHLRSGRPNFRVIAMATNKYPSLVLHGFFDPAGFSMTDTAETQNVINWSIGFTCRRTTPALHDPDALIAAFRDSVLEPV